MNAKRFSLICLLPLSALALSATGCEVSTCSGDECDFGDDDGGLFGDGDGDGDGDDTDGGPGDGDGDDPDGGTGDGDGDGDSVDAGPDAGGDGDGDGEPLADTAEFCQLQLEVGLDWLTTFEACCIGGVPDDVNTFLLVSLNYPATVADPVQLCIDAREKPIKDGDATFNGAKARECAEELLDYYDVPDLDCPAAGFDLIDLAGQIGHGVPAIRQIPACREAFAGKLKAGDECEDHFQCEGNLRCRAMAGSGMEQIKGCQDPVGDGGECVNSSDCADTLICLGAPGEGVCRPGDMLTSVGADCARTSQCEEGTICECADGLSCGQGETGSCSEATGGTLVCAQ